MSTKTKLALAIALVLSASSAALAAPRHTATVNHHATTSKIDSGYGPPRNWSEIEQGAIGGNSN
jgi:hypothetical protein